MSDIFIKVFTDIHFAGAFIQTVILLGIGCYLRKSNKIEESGKKAITAIVWKIAVPCLAFNAFMQDFNTNNFMTCITEFAIAVVLYFILIVTGRIIFIKKGREIAVIASLFMAVGQTTLFSMPVLQSVYAGREDEVMLYISVISIIFRIMVYLVGFYLISGEKIETEHLGSSLKRIFFTPIMIGMFSGMFIYLFQSFTPQVFISSGTYSLLRFDKTIPVVYQTVLSLTKIVNPLAMLLIGMSIGEGNVRESFTDINAWTIAILRNIVSPVFVLIISYFLKITGIIDFNEYSFVTIVIAFSAPVSVSLCVFCVQYHRCELLAARTCMLSTILSIITMPLCFVMCYAVLR